MEHFDLISEMVYIENMNTQERLLVAKRRRLQQLKLWFQREKEWLQQQRNFGKSLDVSSKRFYKKSVTFNDNVMLLEAASRNDTEEVKQLLSKGVSPNTTNEDGLTALHQCCIDNNEEMMQLLIDFGANVNAEDSEKWTPLHAAATCGHIHLVRYLINSGANLLAVNADGNMPYDICEDEDALDYIENEMAKRGITQELIDETRASTEMCMLKDLELAVIQGYDLETTFDQNAKLLHIASANGYIKVVEFLLDHHVAVDSQDIDGWTPAHCASCWNQIEVLEILVQNGADLNALTKQGETPADICENPELRERIIQLKYEQESKKLHEVQKNRVRRSQSNNTRTQSIRRMSIRDKTLTSKKDAVEEARLRLQVQDVSVSDKVLGSEFDSSLDYDSQLDKSKLSNSNKMAETQPDTSKKDNNLVNTGGSLNNDNNNVMSLDFPTETAYSSENNGKINIHVSVTINTSTLAELKKQRAKHRNSSDFSSGQVFCQQNTSLGDNNGLQLPAIKRFSGNTGENFINDPHTTRCCILL